jgi:hypothetical protein
MNFLRKILAKYRIDKGPEETGTSSEMAEIISGELWAVISEHQLPVINSRGNKNSISFVSKGLVSAGQQELFFVLKANKRDNTAEKEILLFFRNVYSLAMKGHIALAGSITKFGEKDLWGWKGIVYSKPPQHLRKSLPDNTLNMIFLNEEELQAVQEFGYTRVLSMMGKQSRYFPFPYWCDNFRSSLLIRGVNSKTLLNKVRRIALPEASVTVIDRKIYMKADKNTVLEIGAQPFPDEIPVAILPSLAASADSCLTWSFEDNKPEAIIIPESKGEVMGGCFLMLIGQQEQNAAKIHEDGFSVFLKTDQWYAFWNAFASKQVFILKTEEQFMDFSLIWE